MTMQRNATQRAVPLRTLPLLALLATAVACQTENKQNTQGDSAKRLIHTGLTVSTPSTTDSATEPPPEWQFSGAITCADPTLRDESKWDIRELGDAPVSWKGLVAAGVIVADLDGNNRLDIVRTRREGLQVFMQTMDGSFSAQHGLVDEFDLTNAASGTAADFDGDGDKDLLLLHRSLAFFHF
mgnify:CR=1 FL=1